MGMVYSFNLTSTMPYPSGMAIGLRAFAVNGVGKGVYSDVNQIKADKVPQFMSTPVVSLSNINPTWIYVSWTAISGDA